MRQTYKQFGLKSNLVMKKFGEILDSFKEDSAMDFDEDLSSIRMALEYANECIRSFEKIQFRGGNEDYIKRIVAKLHDTLLARKLIDPETNQPVNNIRLRKITLYLILNTETPHKAKLVEDTLVCHLIDSAPQLTKCLLLACIWALDLITFFGECISYTPNWYALWLVEASVESLKYCGDLDTLAIGERIICAIYFNVARSDYRNTNIADKRSTLGKLIDVLNEYLQEILEVNEKKMEKWSKNRRYKFLGFLIKHNLAVIQLCCGIYQNRSPLQLTNADADVFNKLLRSETEREIDIKIEGYSEVVDDTLKKINISLLNTLQRNIMEVDCHAYMYWVEIDLTDELTLQRVVGEAAYTLTEFLNVNECFQHSVQDQLAAITIKPVKLEERIIQLTIGELITKLETMPRSENDLGLWIDSFIGRGGLVLGNQECLDTLESFMDILTSGNIRQLILYACNECEEDGVDDKLVELCLNSFDHLPESEILPLVVIATDQQEYTGKHIFQKEDFEVRLIGTFNKSTYTEEPKTFLKLLFQNPSAFYEKVFDVAIHCEPQMEHMLAILKATAQVAFQYIESNLSTMIDEKSNACDEHAPTYRSIPRFIPKLFFLNVLEPNTFIKRFLYEKHFIPALMINNTTKIAVLMKVFWGISLKYNFNDMSPPILVMAGQVLEQCRWDLLKYTFELETIVVKTVEFISEVMKKYLPIAGEQDKAWIKSRISSFRPMTTYYYQRIFIGPNDTVLAYDKYLYPKGFDSTSREEKVQFLSRTLVRCTEKEIAWLTRNPECLDSFWETFELICAIVSKASTQKENVNNCFRHCCTSFFNVIRYQVTASTNTIDEKVDLFQNIVNLIQCMEKLPLFNDLLLIARQITQQIIEACPLEGRNQLSEEIGAIVDEIPKEAIKNALNISQINEAI